MYILGKCQNKAGNFFKFVAFTGYLNFPSKHNLFHPGSFSQILNIISFYHYSSLFLWVKSKISNFWCKTHNWSFTQNTTCSSLDYFEWNWLLCCEIAQFCIKHSQKSDYCLSLTQQGLTIWVTNETQSQFCRKIKPIATLVSGFE